MAESIERRSRQEQETLMYNNPERATAWREGMQEKLQAAPQAGVRRERELVGEALADEFAQEGVGVTSLTHPWEHTAAEHAEVQQLVDLSFASDLRAALKKARGSPNWPRNLDLFHDVLTTEMYELVREHKLNKQPLLGWVLFGLGIILGTLLVSGILLVAAY
jgi:hypothetical protein